MKTFKFYFTWNSGLTDVNVLIRLYIVEQVILFKIAVKQTKKKRFFAICYRLFPLQALTSIIYQ